MPKNFSPNGQRAAFYDFDGTLASSNVVTRYAWFAKNHPSRLQAAWRYGKTLAGVPLWILLDTCSRRAFNVVFYRQYRGFEEEWLRSRARAMFEHEVLPRVFPHAKARVAEDRRAGYKTVMVSGGLDFALQAAVEYFAFDDLIANRLEFAEGIATGRIVKPLLAGREKVEAMRAYCERCGFAIEEAKAYSDSWSDMPMLEAVGHPAAANPDVRLRCAAAARSWPVYDLTKDHRKSGAREMERGE